MIKDDRRMVRKAVSNTSAFFPPSKRNLRVAHKLAGLQQYRVGAYPIERLPESFPGYRNFHSPLAFRAFNRPENSHC
jgi:hypothetical protein